MFSSRTSDSTPGIFWVLQQHQQCSKEIFRGTQAQGCYNRNLGQKWLLDLCLCVKYIRNLGLGSLENFILSEFVISGEQPWPHNLWWSLWFWDVCASCSHPLEMVLFRYSSENFIPCHSTRCIKWEYERKEVGCILFRFQLTVQRGMQGSWNSGGHI